MKRLECRHGCRMLEITPSLYLCPHASYGEAAKLLGAVETARALLDKAGGYSVVLARVEDEEGKKKAAAAERRKHQHERLRYG